MERFWFRLSRPLVISFSLVLVAACSGEDTGDDPAAQARILSFEADPSTVEEGQGTILRWTTKNAQSVRLIADGVLLDLGELPPAGEAEVAPARATTYRLEATGKGGSASTATVEVEVAPAGAPTIDRFEASATVVRTGASVSLSWSVQRATSIEIREVGGRVLLQGAQAEGSFEATPTRATTYQLLATSPRGAASAEVSVSIGTPPSLSFSATPEVLQHGEDVQLTWTVVGARSIQVIDPSGVTLHEGPGEDGSLPVSADVSGPYRAIASNEGGEVIVEARVEVRPKIASFSATVQGAESVGAPALLEWEVLGAERLELMNSSGVVIELTEPVGSRTMPLGNGGNFLLRAVSGPSFTEETAQVQVVEEPLIRRFETVGLVTAGHGMSGVVQALWEIDGAATIRLEVDPGGLVDLTDKSPRIDETDVTLLGPGWMKLIASNPAGMVEKVIPAPVDPVPSIPAFFAAPSRAGSGEAVEIHWQTLHAHQVVLEMDGAQVGIDPFLVNGSFTTPSLSSRSTYVLRATNTLGYETISEPLTVEVGSPNILSLRTHDGRSLYPIEATVGLHWKNDGGSNLTITDMATGQVVCQTSVWVEIREGSCSITLPDRQDLKTYVMQVSNTSGTDSQSIEVHAVTGPIITSFTSDRPAITEGETVLFSWEVQKDIEGNVPTLTLRDQNGTEYPMEGVEALAGSKRFTVPTWGDYTFTLTASSAVKPDFPFELPLTVYGVPVIDQMAAAPTFAENEGDPIQFSWASTHGASMEIRALDRQGQAGAVLFSSATKSVVDAGTASLTPTIASPNVRVVVRNPLGAPKSADFRIGVSPASIDYFTADRTDILLGEEVTLSWGTARATDVHLDGFIDLSQRPTATDLNMYSMGDNGEVTFQFPAGFTFPHDGQRYQSARVTVDGWLSFDPAAWGYCCNTAIPSSDSDVRNIDFMPFWDDLHTSNNTPGGTILWEHFSEPSPHVVIQWKNLGFYSTSRNPSDLNFQIILHENGDFEYRYGRMFGQSGYANGQDATVAAQNRAGTLANIVLHNSSWTGGLSDKSFYFKGWDASPAYRPAAVAPIGTRTLAPTTSRTFKLRAWNGHSEDAREVTVNVHPKGQVSAWTVPAEPAPGEPVALHWAGEGLTALEVEDGSGNVIHTATPSQLAGGSLSLGGLTMGDHTYTLRAVGGVDWDVFSETIVFPVYDAFSIDSFEASETYLRADEVPITLSWTTTNVAGATITESPGGQVTTIGATEFASGTLSRSPTRTTTYLLEVESFGRVRQSEVTVQVRSGWIDGFTATPNPISAGGSSTLSWSTGGAGTVTLMGPGIDPPAGSFVEVSDQVEFQDVSSGVLLASNIFGGSYYGVSFTGFSFPYFGQSYTSLRMAGTGFITFDPSFGSWAWTPTTLPNSGQPHVHLAPFWGDMDLGSLYGDCIDEPVSHCILQFTGLKPYSDPGTLNFQVVLYEAGVIEYRYGVMSTPGTSFAQGLDFTVGMQKPGGSKGTQVKGPSGTVPGGLAGRSWRWMPSVAASGSTQVTPTTSGTYHLCVFADEWVECEEIEIVVN